MGEHCLKRAELFGGVSDREIKREAESDSAFLHPMGKEQPNQHQTSPTTAPQVPSQPLVAWSEVSLESATHSHTRGNTVTELCNSRVDKTHV